MTPVKNSQTGKSKAAAGKSASPAEKRKPEKSGGAAKGQASAKSRGASRTVGNAARSPDGGKYKTAARRRPGRRGGGRKGGFRAFAFAFALILLLGGGLIYALAPGGLDLMGWGKNSEQALQNGGGAQDATQKPYAMGSQDYEADEGWWGQPSGAGEVRSGEAVSAAELESSIVRIDELLRRAMEQHGITPGSPRLVDVLPSLSGKANFLFQVLNFSAEGSKEEQRAVVARTIAELADTLPKLRPAASLTQTAPDCWTISVAGAPTHEITFRQNSIAADVAPTTTSKPSGAGIPGGPGRLVIVIDDIGESLGAAKSLVSLNFPVTLAIWPRSGHAAACAELAHTAGREVMIHQPMEPVSYPRNKPGPGAIFTNMSDADIRSVVAENLKLVPYAVGLNNHMGSKLTLNARAIKDVLASLEGSGMFIIDSLTHDHSVFYALAREAGFPALRRDIFLDNEQNVQSILHQLNTAARLAEKKGWAVAIGHPYPQTIAALIAWQSSRPAGVRIINARELLGK